MQPNKKTMAELVQDVFVEEEITEPVNDSFPCTVKPLFKETGEVEPLVTTFCGLAGKPSEASAADALVLSIKPNP